MAGRGWKNGAQPWQLSAFRDSAQHVLLRPRIRLARGPFVRSFGDAPFRPRATRALKVGVTDGHRASTMITTDIW